MERLCVDWHIHTTLSPCGSLSMEPSAILDQARQKGLGVIGITDHNSTRQARVMKAGPEVPGLLVLTGAEVTTREEIHCLAFFDDIVALDKFQDYLDKYLPEIENNPEYFGDQVVVDFSGNILYEEKRLLISAIDQSLEEVSSFVAGLNGIFIPAHINRTSYSLMSQLGFVPSALKADALEWVPRKENDPGKEALERLYGMPVIYSSDAHMPEDIGRRFTCLELGELSFEGIRQCLAEQRKSIGTAHKTELL